jgi:hypothetical protein
VYWILNEDKQPIETDVITWTNWFEDIENRRVALTAIGDYEVSTVFLGIAHGYDEKERPILFESMLFNLGSRKDLDCSRYATWDDAMLGHTKMVKKWSAK